MLTSIPSYLIELKRKPPSFPSVFLLMLIIFSLFGLRNFCYLIFVTALWKATGLYEVFFALTSFIHYFRYLSLEVYCIRAYPFPRYISTFYVRKGIDFGSFKRDVLFFKTVALIQLFYHYFYPATHSFQFDIISIAMIATGYTISFLATEAIGIDRTYFAAELGLVEPKWINKFPYG